MDRNELAELRERRAALHAQMDTMLREAPEEGLSNEDEQKYDRIEGDFDKLDRTIKRAERQESRDLAGARFDADDPERDDAQRGETREARFASVIESYERTARESGTEAAQRALAETEEYREAFIQAAIVAPALAREVAPEYKRALNLGVSAEGGITAPAEFIRRLLEDPELFGVIRSLAFTFSTSHGRELQYAELVAKGSAGWTNAEVTATPDNFKSDPQFGGPKVIGAHPAQREIVTSKDLLQDSVFDIEALILRVARESFALLENPAFITGDGSGKPQGFLPDVPVANVATPLAAGELAATDITHDALVDVQHALPRPYRRKAKWLFNDNTFRDVRKIKDGNGDPIWQPGLKDGAPDRILGKPYEVDDDMPDSGASARPVAYGDYTGYWIRDVLELRVTPLPETYARSRQMGYLFDKRVDGVLMEPSKVAALEHPAA